MNLAPGTLGWMYLILAGSMRFLVEFWRINPPIASVLSEAQWISLLLIAIGVVMLMIRPVRHAPLNRSSM
jgi:prolipoprotein diacylglyceryltransferase